MMVARDAGEPQATNRYFARRRKLAFVFSAWGVIPLAALVLFASYGKTLSARQIFPAISLIIVLALVLDVFLVALAVIYSRKLGAEAIAGKEEAATDG